jgi:hypothetical protein
LEEIKFNGNKDIPANILKLDSPTAVFKHFFNQEIVDLIVRETNLYAATKKISNPISVSDNDVLKFIGICYIASIIRLPNVRKYWHSEMGVEVIKSCMPQKRFEKIRSVIHFNSNENILPRDHPNHDRLLKLSRCGIFYQRDFKRFRTKSRCRSTNKYVQPK